ncbi:MAG: endolytic transglycosylase MltG [Methylotenera sp.]|nr:endolytic transglycosylase MltG [Oligoflexia bacterium]
MKKLVFALLILIIAGISLVQVGRFVEFATSPIEPGNEETIVIDVQRGQSPQDISRKLEEQKIIRNAKWFVWLGKFERTWPKVKAGEYGVSTGMSPLKILEIITSGISINRSFTIHEGDNIYEVADGLESEGYVQKDRFLTLCRDPKFISTLGFHDAPPLALEGYLFPDTYFLNKGISAEEIVKRMVKRFQLFWGENERKRALELGMTRHQLITLASMVEKETGAPQERPMIASVFYNRLRKKMRLQSDPTTIYGMWDRYKGKIHKTDLSIENPYNTYTIPALPIGPIGNPGKEALTAALHPATSNFLFFVSHNDGTHEFTENYGAHQDAVRKFQLDPKMREGKSWRDLNKKKTQTAAPAASAGG